MEKFKLWDVIPGDYTEEPDIEYYKAENKKGRGAVVIFPGGGYCARAEHEGKGYAEFLNSIGLDAFVVQYRVRPKYFPLPLADARRSVRWVRHNAKKFGIDKDKIAVMGSSAGGHLAALVSTYQILCYPVINLSDFSICHVGSVISLLGEEKIYSAAELDPILIADEKTPEAFIWHTSNDGAVNVSNSLKYGEKLRTLNKQFEMHIFPDGPHGLGLAADRPHVAEWSKLLEKWLIDIGLIK